MSIMSMIATPVVAAVAFRTDHIVAVRVYLGVLAAMSIVFVAFGMTFATTDEEEVETVARDEFPRLSAGDQARWDNDPLVLRDAYLEDARSNAAAAITAALVYCAAAVAQWAYHQHKVEAATTSEVQNQQLEQFKAALHNRRVSAMMPDPKAISRDLKQAKAKARRGSTILAQQQMMDPRAQVDAALTQQDKRRDSSATLLPGSSPGSTYSLAEGGGGGGVLAAGSSDLVRLREALVKSGTDAQALVEVCKAWKASGGNAEALAAALADIMSRGEERVKAAAEAAASAVMSPMQRKMSSAHRRPSRKMSSQLDRRRSSASRRPSHHHHHHKKPHPPADAATAEPQAPAPLSPRAAPSAHRFNSTLASDVRPKKSSKRKSSHKHHRESEATADGVSPHSTPPQMPRKHSRHHRRAVSVDSDTPQALPPAAERVRSKHRRHGSHHSHHSHHSSTDPPQMSPHSSPPASSPRKLAPLARPSSAASSHSGGSGRHHE